MTGTKRRNMTIVASQDPTDLWRQTELVRTRDNEIKATPANLLTIVRKAPELKGAVRFNVLTAQAEVTRRLPGPIDTGLGPQTDAHIASITAWIGQIDTFAVNAKPGMVADAVALAAREHSFDPVVAWLDGLEWDGQARLATYFPAYLGAPESRYSQRVAEILFGGIVARSFQPGCKFDYVVVLEGAQEVGKTTAVRELINPDWHCEATEALGTPALVLQVRGKVVAELGEMTSYSRSEFNRAKQFITQQNDVIRDPYARFVVNHPRRCVFVGTTNFDDWNRDPTGARRFLPVRVSGFKRDAYLADRDQLWAEAVHRHRAGADYWTQPEDAGDEQEARYDQDAWSEPIARWLAGRGAPAHYPAGLTLRPVDQGAGIAEASAADILLYALGVETAKQSRADQMRVGTIMRKFGWAKERPWRDGVRTVRYVRPREDPDAIPF